MILDRVLWVAACLFVGAALLCAAASAHSPAAAECEFYAQQALDVSKARVAGIAFEDEFQAEMRLLNSCPPNCPVTDQDDIKRALEFTQALYQLPLEAVDPAGEYRLNLRMCLQAAGKHRMQPVVPGAVGPQIES